MRKLFGAGLLAAGLAVSTIAGGGADSAANETKPAKRGLFDGLLNRDKAGTNSSLAGFSTGQLNDGIKQALENGLQAAVSQLGRTNGFLTNAAVRIPMPTQLATMERTLRKLKQDALVDQFELTMNRAAEKAVPVASTVFVNAVKQMSVEDAANLLTSKSPEAITEFFRKNTSAELFDKFLPIVKEATSSTGVTSAYNQILEKASTGRLAFLARSAVNVDDYVANKSLDGLFKMVAEEEKRIRANPQARTTEVLKKVFGAIQTPKANQP